MSGLWGFFHLSGKSLMCKGGSVSSKGVGFKLGRVASSKES